MTSLEPRVAAAFDGERGARLAAALFAGFALAAAVVLLWLNHGTSFWNDQLTWFAGLSGSNDVESILVPHNSHLIGSTRLVYLFANELVGPDYLVFRVLGVASVVLAATLFFVWARRRIAPGWALLPAVLLLFYGSAWQHVVGPIGFTVTFSIALGLAALLAVERGDRRGDVLACTFVVLSVFTYTVGLAFLVGVAIAVLLRSDRFRRAWIFLVPLLLYAGWWIWAQQFDQGRTDAGNLTHLAEFFARSMAGNSGGITGVNIPWLQIFDPSPVTDGHPSVLAWIVAAGLTAALVWRILKGGLPRSFWASLGVLVTFWLAAGIADIDVGKDGTLANAIRYVFPGSLALLMVLVDAVSGFPIRGRRAAALVAVFAFSLTMNVIFLNAGADYLREQGTTSRVELAMVELRAGLQPGADGPAPPAPDPEFVADLWEYTLSNPPKYLGAVSRYGSPALTLDELRDAAAPQRTLADFVLSGAGGVAFFPDAGDATPGRPCVRIEGGGEPSPLPTGSRLVRPDGGGSEVPLSLSRFGDPPGATIGVATAGTWSALGAAPDAAPEPWLLSLPPETALRSCPFANPEAP